MAQGTVDQDIIDLSNPKHPDSPYNPANWVQPVEEVLADFDRMGHIRCDPSHHPAVETG
jgi:hypothetical protein